MNLTFISRKEPQSYESFQTQILQYVFLPDAHCFVLCRHYKFKVHYGLLHKVMIVDNWFLKICDSFYWRWPTGRQKMAHQSILYLTYVANYIYLSRWKHIDDQMDRVYILFNECNSKQKQWFIWDLLCDTRAKWQNLCLINKLSSMKDCALLINTAAWLCGLCAGIDKLFVADLVIPILISIF